MAYSYIESQRENVTREFIKVLPWRLSHAGSPVSRVAFVARGLSSVVYARKRGSIIIDSLAEFPSLCRFPPVAQD